MKKALPLALALTLVLTMFCGCGLKSFDDTLSDASINLNSCSVCIHFKSEMAGGVDVYTKLDGDDASSFISSMSYSTPIKETKDSYSVQMSASHQIVISVGDTEKLTVYYDDVKNWLVLPITEETKSGSSLMFYRFFTPDPVFSALLDVAYAKRTSDEGDQQLETSDLVLRASVTSDMLGQSGTDVDYELYTGSYAFTDTASKYHIYTSAELPDVLTDSQGLILASLGEKPDDGLRGLYFKR